MDDEIDEGNTVSFINTGRMKPIVKMVVPRRTRFVCSFIERRGEERRGVVGGGGRREEEGAGQKIEYCRNRGTDETSKISFVYGSGGGAAAAVRSC